MATYQCPKGHTSTDSDYCSECGALIGPPTISQVASSVTSVPASGADVCPDCMTPRTPGARFCEVCRYDFDVATHVAQAPSGLGKPIVQVPPAPIAPVVTSLPAALASPPPVDSAPVASGVVAPTSPITADVPVASSPAVAAPPQRLNAVVITDPALAEDEEQRQQCPQGEPDLVFPLDLEENLVGRRSDNKKVYPEVDISDPGVSHRHLKLVRQADGSFVALELGSANGTTLNGVALKPGRATPIAVGDELLVGMWTRLQIRPR